MPIFIHSHPHICESPSSRPHLPAQSQTPKLPPAESLWGPVCLQLVWATQPNAEAGGEVWRGCRTLLRSGFLPHVVLSAKSPGKSWRLSWKGRPTQHRGVGVGLGQAGGRPDRVHFAAPEITHHGQGDRRAVGWRPRGRGGNQGPCGEATVASPPAHQAWGRRGQSCALQRGLSSAAWPASTSSLCFTKGPETWTAAPGWLLQESRRAEPPTGPHRPQGAWASCSEAELGRGQGLLEVSRGPAAPSVPLLPQTGRQAAGASPRALEVAPSLHSHGNGVSLGTLRL